MNDRILNDSDIILIQNKMNWKYDWALILTLIISIPLLFISPYIPSTKGLKLIDSMEYYDAVLFFSLIWFGCIIIVYFYNKIKVKNEFNKYFLHFSKKEINTEIIEIQKSSLKRNEVIRIRFENEINDFEFDPDMFCNVKAGDKVNLVIETITKTVLKIEKLTDVINIRQS